MNVGMQNRNVRSLIGYQYLCLKNAPVSERNKNAFRSLDDVLIGHNNTVGSNDDPGSERVLDALPAVAEQQSVAEEAPERRSVEKLRRRPCVDDLLGIDVDDRRAGFLDKRCIGIRRNLTN